MNKKLPIISLFFMSIVSIMYWTFKPEKLYDAKWNESDTTLAITINGEISTTFPTSRAYNPSVECTSGTGKIEWSGSKWVLTTSGIEKGSTRCNVDFKNLPPFVDTILANNTVQDPITTPGTEVSTSGEALLASTEDDYGTSYYFRGAVKNNYVQFANKCWKIVRITGDGSVKLVLHNDNTSNAANPCSSANNSTNAAFARYSGTYNSEFNSSYNDNAYVGFKYGTVGASDYASAHANTNNSTILTSLETWYIINLEPYESKLADTIWCNDKSTVNGGLGYGTEYTEYAAYNRLDSTKQPTLKCPNDNKGGKLSKFTVSDITNGNGNLTYKIGLLTADEIAFAGSIAYTYNRSTYLQENIGTSWWWSLSPTYFSGGAVVWGVYSGGLDGSAVLRSDGVRPAISLISSTSVTGNGTSDNPYIIN